MNKAGKCRLARITEERRVTMTREKIPEPTILGPVVLALSTLYIVCWAAGVFEPFVADSIRLDAGVVVGGWLAFLYLPFGILETISYLFQNFEAHGEQYGSSYE